MTGKTIASLEVSSCLGFAQEMILATELKDIPASPCAPKLQDYIPRMLQVHFFIMIRFGRRIGMKIAKVCARSSRRLRFSNVNEIRVWVTGAHARRENLDPKILATVLWR